MIKALITDIAYDNIKLSQALTRAKLVENKIKNDTLKKWLNKELEGYDFDDTYLPSYRKVWSVVHLTAELPFGRTQTFPVMLSEDFGAEVIDAINHHRILEPISIVEEQIANIKDIKGVINLPPQQVQLLASVYQEQVKRYGGVIRSGSREVGRVQFQNVLEQTKQKLLDTLMELEDEFPNLLNDYVMNKENSEKVQNIITNNIYGSNNPTSIAAGANVSQTVTVKMISGSDEEKLGQLGVEKKQIEELKSILATSSDKPALTGKIMKWLGSVTASVAGRGLYDNIPAITDFVQKLIE
ncbi:hypothetical protein [Chryseosolibacter indicus]|uniref:AbiTii domain-containing protein n=1 Tax=Chryseosolibacter indicus TaxID=2782351 RepID=A0ABS5VX26_9BACT|nr:hypothetical protein [Chryseosolibacter indicus]MBT1705434.1 hypothetical protein [Chryseosolibacter indicus]